MALQLGTSNKEVDCTKPNAAGAKLRGHPSSLQESLECASNALPHSNDREGGGGRWNTNHYIAFSPAAYTRASTTRGQYFEGPALAFLESVLVSGGGTFSFSSNLSDPALPVAMHEAPALDARLVHKSKASDYIGIRATRALVLCTGVLQVCARCCAWAHHHEKKETGFNVLDEA